MTLSRKHKYNKSSFYRRYQKDIRVKYIKDKQEMNVNFGTPELKRNPMNFSNNLVDDPLKFLNMEIRTVNSFGDPCINCGSKDRIEMHHIRNVRTINLKLNPFDTLMAKINRKQVPLCHQCHQEVHTGKYDGKSLNHRRR